MGTHADGTGAVAPAETPIRATPFDVAGDDERLGELGDEIATLSAHLHAATHRLLVLLAEFDRLGGWRADGHRTCAHWLAWRTGVDLGAAREKVRAARALEALPLTSASMARGELSFAKVRALTRVATAANEADLIELARAGTAANLERVVRAWRWLGARAEAERDEARHRTRSLSVAVDPDGMYIVRARVEPEVGALFMKALDAAGDALYRRAPGVEPAQRRADALGLLAERAMAVGLSGEDSPVSGSRAERYQVVLHVGASDHSAEVYDPAAETGDPARCAGPACFDAGAELQDGTRVSAETSRRLACDAGLVAIGHARDGTVLDVGRRTRTIPPAIRRALEARDRGCRFPGCGSRFCDAHHVKHWSEGGETKLDNLVLLCKPHHRMLHEGGYSVELAHVMEAWTGGVSWRATFYGRDGMPLADAPQPPAVGSHPVEALLADNRLGGIQPTWHTAQPHWRHDEDIPQALVVRALRATDAA